MAVNSGSSSELNNGSLRPELSPKSSESHVSDVSVCVTLVTSVDAESVDVLMLPSVMDADEEPIMTTFGTAAAAAAFGGKAPLIDV